MRELARAWTTGADQLRSLELQTEDRPMTERKRIPVKIVENSCYHRFSCGFCSGQQGKSSSLALVKLDDDDEEQIICENCLIAGKDGIEERLLSRARASEACAAESRRRVALVTLAPARLQRERTRRTADVSLPSRMPGSLP